MEKIHMGQRLKRIVEDAKRGMGVSLLVRELNVSKTTIYNWYVSESLDMKTVVRVCELYSLKVNDFLGVPAEDLPVPLQIGAIADPDAQMEKLVEIERKVDMILRKLK
jgi:AcrR family transcriptional regulator